ncbi:SapC family protein [Cellvibrio sp. pealriver]|uniref:SapC family protein n=1 Tax=Cellvibrio sp. pealriver TaxID=1622269 RepID=UPI00066FD004|nr:SapC family protein [Cellvibrio sp. pealriver]
MKTGNIVLLDPVKHNKLGVNTAKLNSTHHQVNRVYININELSNLVHEYPIFINKNSTTGQFQLNAILGFETGENLYLQHEQWNARFIPMDLLRHPFQVIFPENNPKAIGQIAINESSELLENIAHEKAEAIFDHNGNPSPYLLRIQKMITQLMSGAQLSRIALQELHQHELLMPITLDITLNNGAQTALEGFYGIDENALQQLSGAALEECHKRGYLNLCYLLLSSATHLEKLISWKSNLITPLA